MFPCLPTSGNIVAKTELASKEAKMFPNKFRNSGEHFMKYWGGECQGPCKIYMSVPW